MRKKKTRFSAVKAVKSAARQSLGMPSPTRVVPDVKAKNAGKAGKHRANLEKLLADDN